MRKIALTRLCASWFARGLVVSVLFCSGEVRAQSEGNSDFSLFGAYMLPNQIPGVEEILPLFGGRYAFPLPAGALEAYFENAHAEGVDWTSIGASMRGEIPLAPGISALIYAGPSLHWYIPEGSTQRQTDYGLHAGVGGMLYVADTLWLRTDLKFLGNPGTALYLMFSLFFRMSSGA